MCSLNISQDALLAGLKCGEEGSIFFLLWLPYNFWVTKESSGFLKVSILKPLAQGEGESYVEERLI